MTLRKEKTRAPWLPFCAGLWLAFSSLTHAHPAQASPIVADLSTYRIAIDAGFSGIRLFIFGARSEGGDIVAVIRGPERNFIVRKKESVGGVWINRKQLTFKGVPDFYAIAASHPLESLQAAPLLRQLDIGSADLLPVPGDTYDKALYPEFSAALLAWQRSRQLYNESLDVSFMGETLFKTTVPFPDTIPEGRYTAEIYLIRDGEVAGMHVVPIDVEKSGFDAAVHDFAHRYAALYGLLAIGLALAAGWSAGKLFGKT